PGLPRRPRHLPLRRLRHDHPRPGRIQRPGRRRRPRLRVCRLHVRPAVRHRTGADGMTRFSDDYDWDFGRYMLWEQAVTNAMSGRRGQAALRDLEEALVALPEKRLVDTLCKDGEVCAISALV